jgi:hypothetical protein
MNRTLIRHPLFKPGSSFVEKVCLLIPAVVICSGRHKYLDLSRRYRRHLEEGAYVWTVAWA